MLVGLWGPKARQVLEKVTAADVSQVGFPYYLAR
jgi:glycine cleavage system aminomethyltransferase T